MGADLVPPGTPSGGLQIAVHTVVAASTLVAPMRLMASTVKPEIDKSFKDEKIKPCVLCIVEPRRSRFALVR
jgi:hypothetical protein